MRSCVHRCVICVRHRANPCTQQMGDLPSERVIPANPFAKTGVDYAGPFIIRDSPGRGKKTRKGYISVFVCLVTRAIYLETVSDYSSAAFLAAFKRFSLLYGIPALMMSDNGTNFQGAERELREAFDEIKSNKDLKSYFATKELEWRFIPPGAPYFARIWETGVKSVKHHLKRVINKS